MQTFNFSTFFILYLFLKCASVMANYTKYQPATEEQIKSQGSDFWWNYGTETLKQKLQGEKEQEKVARNVIVFIGDGMGISTITAGRIYKGQRKYGKMGEDHVLNFEKFPHVGLVKTYNVDRQIPDSAGTATAMFTGIKIRYKVLGLDVFNQLGVFDKQTFENGKLETLMDWAQAIGKDTGIVTTTRITHATPAATFAKINHRDWECDSEIPVEYRSQVKDIARQLVENSPGKNFKVILGGGQQQMGYVSDVETSECSRADGLNLPLEWLNMHNSSNASFVTNNAELDAVSAETEYLLGLFSADHMPMELVRNKDPSGTPSLTDMTRKALQILKKSPNGFVLLVEGGLIDKAHHKNQARLSLGETAEFDNAIEHALNETGSDTLIIVTADHSHGFTISGYPKRGNDIFGLGNETMKEEAYYTAGYANGPGFNYHFVENSSYPWINVTNDETLYTNPWYQFRGTAYLEDETHGGEDVAVFAKGPGSHLIRGVFEQNYLAHVISYASCIGPQASLNEYCHQAEGIKSSSSFDVSCFEVLVSIMLIHVYINVVNDYN